MKKYLLFWGFIFGILTKTWAQDAQMSQFYAAPLYYNPALTGGGYAPRVMVNYRNQWPSLNANFKTSIFAIDHFVEKIHSGFGVMVLDDKQGNRFKNTEISALYSYQLQLNETNFMRFGMQGTYSFRGFDKDGLVWGDQINDNGYTGLPSGDPIASLNIVNQKLFDVSAGGIFYNPDYFIGGSVHHITNPKISFLDPNAQQKIGMNINVSGGYNFNIGTLNSRAANLDKEVVITPTFLYKRQGKFSQLDLGAYTTYAPFTLGLFYRGIPFKKIFTKFPNQDAITALLGYRMDNFSIGYSYDFTISKLGLNTGGSHEVSVSYQLDRNPEKSEYMKRKKKSLSCPKF